MTTFTLSADAIRSIATLVHASSNDDVTPILSAVQLTVTPTEWRAVATDRYMVAELTGAIGDYIHTLPGDDSETTLLIRAKDIAEYAKRMGARATVPVMLTVSDDGQSVEISNYEAISTYRLMNGNFPAVDRLFPEESAFAELPNIGIDPAKLARIGKIMPESLVALSPRYRAESPLNLRFTHAGHGSGKPGVIFITRGNRAEGFRALLQPVTLRD